MRWLEEERRAKMAESCTLAAFMRERACAMAFATFDSNAMNVVLKELTSTADRPEQPRFRWRVREPAHNEDRPR